MASHVKAMAAEVGKDVLRQTGCCRGLLPAHLVVAKPYASDTDGVKSPVSDSQAKSAARLPQWSNGSRPGNDPAQPLLAKSHQRVCWMDNETELGHQSR